MYIILSRLIVLYSWYRANRCTNMFVVFVLCNMICFYCAFGLNSVLGVHNLWGASPPHCDHSVTFGFEAQVVQALSVELTGLDVPQEVDAMKLMDLDAARRKNNPLANQKRRRSLRRGGETQGVRRVRSQGETSRAKLDSMMECAKEGKKSDQS